MAANQRQLPSSQTAASLITQITYAVLIFIPFSIQFIGRKGYEKGYAFERTNK